GDVGADPELGAEPEVRPSLEIHTQGGAGDILGADGGLVVLLELIRRDSDSEIRAQLALRRWHPPRVDPVLRELELVRGIGGIQDLLIVIGRIVREEIDIGADLEWGTEIADGRADQEARGPEVP